MDWDEAGTSERIEDDDEQRRRVLSGSERSVTVSG